MVEEYGKTRVQRIKYLINSLQEAPTQLVIIPIEDLEEIF